MTRHDGQPLPTTPEPSLRGRVLGIELRRVREAAGLTVAELAARSGQSPEAVQRLEKGLTDEPTPAPTVRCAWGSSATSMVNILCRASERIDIFAPLGIHPALEDLGVDRCTAYVLESTTVDRHDVVVRVLRHEAGAFPGIEHHPLTRFSLPDSTAVVFYPYLHAAHFTEEPEHLLAAYSLFERLAEFTGTDNPAQSG